MPVHEVITPENVVLTYPVAGIGSRFVAWVIDVLAILLLGVAGVMVGSVLEVGRGGLGTAVILLWTFGLMWCYFLFFEWLWHGQTPGKRLLGIRVIGDRGTGINFFESAVRNLLRAVDSLPALYALAAVVVTLDPKNRRLGDLAAGTLVVHVPARSRPVRIVREPGTEAGRSEAERAGRRLGQLDRRQKQLLLELCVRREQLQVRERARLFSAVADFLEQRFALAPAEAESDERFVLKIIAAAPWGERASDGVAP